MACFHNTLLSSRETEYDSEEVLSVKKIRNRGALTIWISQSVAEEVAVEGWGRRWLGLEQKEGNVRCYGWYCKIVWYCKMVWHGKIIIISVYLANKTGGEQQ